MSTISKIEERKKTVKMEKVFASFNHIIEGWYWVCSSHSVRENQIKPVTMLGRELIVYRGEDGIVRVMDAFCPHMGAHLAEGKVDGVGVRCFFHHWKFNDQGSLVTIPCQKMVPNTGVRAWPTKEKYGMIWVWAGETPRYPVPYIPELKGIEQDFRLGNNFEKGCHPNIVMVNAIDEQHFHSVHPMASSLADGLHFAISPYNENCLVFDNDKPVPNTNIFTRILGRFYSGPLTYRMAYWNGSTGSVTIGPDALHFHIIFALRPTESGCSEGQTILVTKKRRGMFGWLFNHLLLIITEIVGNYFAKGDTQVFQTIRWDFKTPIKADRPILAFAKHLEEQRKVPWGAWDGDVYNSAVKKRRKD
jgi:phenylpropionate dioxygenase-like ring-hydroxylating dioxygenase large terminal subunit